MPLDRMGRQPSDDPHLVVGDAARRHEDRLADAGVVDKLDGLRGHPELLGLLQIHLAIEILAQRLEHALEHRQLRRYQPLDRVVGVFVHLDPDRREADARLADAQQRIFPPELHEDAALAVRDPEHGDVLEALHLPELVRDQGAHAREDLLPQVVDLALRQRPPRDSRADEPELGQLPLQLLERDIRDDQARLPLHGAHELLGGGHRDLEVGRPRHAVLAAERHAAVEDLTILLRDMAEGSVPSHHLEHPFGPAREHAAGLRHLRADLDLRGADVDPVGPERRLAQPLAHRHLRVNLRVHGEEVGVLDVLNGAAGDQVGAVAGVARLEELVVLAEGQEVQRVHAELLGQVLVDRDPDGEERVALQVLHAEVEAQLGEQFWGEERQGGHVLVALGLDGLLLPLCHLPPHQNRDALPHAGLPQELVEQLGVHALFRLRQLEVHHDRGDGRDERASCQHADEKPEDVEDALAGVVRVHHLVPHGEHGHDPVEDDDVLVHLGELQVRVGLAPSRDRDVRPRVAGVGRPVAA
mmetsp:Transcript_60713/g.159638  ORF Transcript_60713/g.159638 Transcript_60713/m.159638 type:complete len:527 (-) Transcript_60713:1527-3107(-)